MTAPKRLLQVTVNAGGGIPASVATCSDEPSTKRQERLLRKRIHSANNDTGSSG